MSKTAHTPPLQTAQRWETNTASVSGLGGAKTKTNGHILGRGGTQRGVTVNPRKRCNRAALTQSLWIWFLPMSRPRRVWNLPICHLPSFSEMDFPLCDEIFPLCRWLMSHRWDPRWCRSLGRSGCTPYIGYSELFSQEDIKNKKIHFSLKCCCASVCLQACFSSLFGHQLHFTPDTKTFFAIFL